MNLKLEFKIATIFILLINTIECFFNGSRPSAPNDFSFNAIIFNYKRHAVQCSATLIHPSPTLDYYLSSLLILEYE